jgi:RNA polymerase sigma-70 factor, ECF subfamily
MTTLLSTIHNPADSLTESRTATASPATEASGVNWLVMNRPDSGEAEAAAADEDQRRLVEAARSREERVWSALFDENFQAIYRLALYKLRDHHAAEDLAAQTFDEALRGIGRFQYRGVTIRAWLFRIARNLLADYVQQSARQRRASADGLIEKQNELEAAGVRVDLIEALAQLPEAEQLVVTLTLVEDLTNAECAQVLQKRLRDVERLQLAGLSKLRSLLSAEKALAS